MAETLLSMEHIGKTFPGVHALDDVTLEVLLGEVHALLGENGAGKSTLMKILTGAIHKDLGTIRFNGQEVSIKTPGDAINLGISIIHQELNLVQYLDVGQNIFLGREPIRAGGVIDWRTLYKNAAQVLQLVGININPRAVVGDLSIAQQQMVEIGKALSRQARLIVMDEPTSALTERETERLFELIRSLREQGVTIIYISHRMEEIFEIADRVTVLRDGKLVGIYRIGEVTPTVLVNRMVGRDINEQFRKEETSREGKVLEVRHLYSADFLNDINFELYRGEILGLAGLVGSGRTTLARTIFGVEKIQQGEILVDGERLHINSPQTAIRHGVALVPEDRKAQALFLNMAVAENMTMSSMPRLSIAGVVNFTRMRAMTQEYISKLDVRTPSLRQRVRNLSGGNQQKVVIARWLILNPKILILDEPTRGIDVGAKAEIHALMSALVKQGMGIIMISSELPEILGVSDRILVMHEGRITAELNREGATQEKIMMFATGTVDTPPGLIPVPAGPSGSPDSAGSPGSPSPGQEPDPQAESEAGQQA